MTRYITAFALCVFLASGISAQASNIQYSFTIDGVAGTEFSDLTPGTHTLGIWGVTNDNDLLGQGNGGILGFVANLQTDVPASIAFAENVAGFPPSGDGTWASDFDALFSSNFRGVLGGGGFDVGAQTGSANPGSYDSNVFTVGAKGVPSLLTSGDFEWDGTPLSIELIPGDLSAHLLYGDTSGGAGTAFGARNPDELIATSVRIGSSVDIPEPAALALLSLAGVFGFRRRR